MIIMIIIFFSRIHSISKESKQASKQASSLLGTFFIIIPIVIIPVGTGFFFKFWCRDVDVDVDGTCRISTLVSRY